MIRFLLLSLLLSASYSNVSGSRYGVDVEDMSQEKVLEMGDGYLSSDDPMTAIKYYEKGVARIDAEEDSIITALSLHTNMGTAYSAIGDEIKAVEMYRNAILFYQAQIDEIVDESMKKSASDLAAQVAFFLGMTQDELGNHRKSADAYAYAASLDPYHWAALANLGSMLQDHLQEPAEAIIVYNKAYDILTQTDVEPTDPPEDPKLVLSQLQYRIGISITYAKKQKCVMQDDPSREIPCTEMAANAFNYALRLDPDNEGAKHMLASVTADATMKRASNEYVKELFEDYAGNFEHSLVEELGYHGYKKLRKAFGKAFGGEEKVPMFDLVIDAGCGTGLVGEQFRDVSKHLVGVDLSPSIIEEANKARPNLYDETQVGDVTEIFVEKKPVSLIIAGDSYIYFGDLVPLFQSMKEGLMDGGVAAFTLENASEEFKKTLQETNPNWRWQLQPSGRFAHNKKYVEEVAKQTSLKVLYYEEMLGFRKEGGNDVNGHIFIMQKMGSQEL